MGTAWSQSTESNSVVVMVRDVARGEVIEAGDLASSTIGQAPGVKTIPASQINDLVGKQALTDLPAGSLVGPGSAGQPESEDAAVVGLRLGAGRLPQEAMPAGTRVLLVPVASGKAGASGDEPAGEPIEAVVVTAPSELQDGTSWVVDVQVDEGDAVRVAQLAAADQLVLLKRPRS